MKSECAPICNSCETFTMEYKCPVDPNAKNAWAPGDLDKMFTRLTSASEPYLSQYSVEILSSPATGAPWVITMENVVTPYEAKRLIELGAAEGYERSADVGIMFPDGTAEDHYYDGRTSTNAWCGEECYNDPAVQAVIERMTNITGIDAVNSEELQILRYEPGQFYNSHHE
jgi:prolyl 4-hydroxylase